jgi:hypothetical protein
MTSFWMRATEGGPRERTLGHSEDGQVTGRSEAPDLSKSSDQRPLTSYPLTIHTPPFSRSAH